MRYIRLLILMVVLAVFLGIVAYAAEKQAVPDPATDKYPKGCASCHVNRGEGKDYTLAAEAKKVKDHPPVKADATVATCIKCHGGKDETSFKRIIHEIHLVRKGKDNHFVSSYGGATNCIACHAIAENGKVMVKGLEN